MSWPGTWEDLRPPPADEQIQTPISYDRGSIPEESTPSARFSAELRAVKREIIQIKHMVARIPQEVSKEMSRAIPTLVEEALKRLGNNPSSRPSRDYAEPSGPRRYHLSFEGDIPCEGYFTDTYIGDGSAKLKVVLRNSSGSKAYLDVESPMKVKIFVLDGDFNSEDREDWTAQDFNDKVVQRRKGKGELLKGDDEILMNKGVATLDRIAFTDNSTPTRSKKFRLGARVVKGLPPATHIREAVSKAFRVKSKRGKKPSLSLRGDTSHLKNIGNVTCGELAAQDIQTVQDFLQLYNTDMRKMKEIVGLRGEKWLELEDQIKSCKFSDMGYQYLDEASGIVLQLDCVFKIVRVIFKYQVKGYEELDDNQKEQVDELRRTAYEKRHELQRIESPDNLTSMLPEYAANTPQTQTEHLGATSAARTTNLPSGNLTTQGDQAVLPSPCHVAEGATVISDIFAPIEPRSTGPTDQGQLLQSPCWVPEEERMFYGLLIGDSQTVAASESLSPNCLYEMLYTNGQGMPSTSINAAQVLLHNANDGQDKTPNVSRGGVRQCNQHLSTSPTPAKRPRRGS